MKVKTAELTGAALDWAVANCEGYAIRLIKGQLETAWADGGWRPSADWAQGGPIIERERISSGVASWTEWIASILPPREARGYGPTPLIAAMRCFVASKLGDEIDLPEELT